MSAFEGFHLLGYQDRGVEQRVTFETSVHRCRRGPKPKASPVAVGAFLDRFFLGACDNLFNDGCTQGRFFIPKDYRVTYFEILGVGDGGIPAVCYGGGVLVSVIASMLSLLTDRQQ